MKVRCQGGIRRRSDGKYKVTASDVLLSDDTRVGEESDSGSLYKLCLFKHSPLESSPPREQDSRSSPSTEGLYFEKIHCGNHSGDKELNVISQCETR